MIKINRSERRRQQRELEKKTKSELNVMKRLCGRSEKTNALDWALNLNSKEQEYLNFMMTENSKHDIQIYIDAYEMALRCNLNDDTEIINKINRDVEKEGYKVKEYRDNGGNYVMALKNNKEAIIKDYEKGIENNIKEKDLIKDLAVNYKATVNAIKLIIKDYKKDNKVKVCNSNTCPFQERNKCTNDVVLSGKGECHQLNETDVKVTKDTEIVTKKEKIFKFIDEHKDLSKDELQKQMMEQFKITSGTARKYYSLYHQQNVKPDPLAKVKTEVRKELREKVEEVPKNEEIKPVENSKKSKYKIIKEVVQRDIQGEHGVYHIENGSMTIDSITYDSKEDIEKDYEIATDLIEKEYKAKLEELEALKKEKIDNAVSSRNEALEIMEEFV